MIYSMELRQHYELPWQTKCRELKWERGPMMEKYPDFSVFEFPPGPVHDMWIYGTVNMSAGREIELHLFSQIKEEPIAEILTVISYYHREESSLSVGHTVNFGRSWLARVSLYLWLNFIALFGRSNTGRV